MKLVIAVNFSYPHVGGSERVVQLISEAMVKRFGHDVVVLNRFSQGRFQNNGVHYQPACIIPADFIRQLTQLQPDHTLIYGDTFFHWETILKNVEVIPGTKSIAPVGFYKTLEREELKKLFLDRQKHFTVITHSELYSDHQFCVNNGVAARVLRNGIDFKEFANNRYDFRTTQKITTQFITLCVSNFFPGKGQEHLLHILTKFAAKRKDFTAVFCATHTNHQIANRLMDDFKLRLKRCEFEYRFLSDPPRETVIGAFRACDLFTFVSQKEVAPLVIGEAMAAGKPWISLPVGNIESLPGGIVIKAHKDQRGSCVYNQEVYERYCRTIGDLLDNQEMRATLGRGGAEEARTSFDMDMIVELYHGIFRCQKTN